MIKNKLGLFILLVFLFSRKSIVAEGVMGSVVGSFVYSTGAAIGNINPPLVGPLKHILPFGVIGFCVKKFPKQTLLLLSCCIAYLLVKNETVRQAIDELMYGKVEVPVSCVGPIDENIFVFDTDIVIDSPQMEPAIVQEQEEVVASQVGENSEYNVQEFIEITNECADVVGGLEQMSDVCDDSAVLEMHDEVQVQEDEFTLQEVSYFQSDEDEAIAVENSIFEHVIE